MDLNNDVTEKNDDSKNHDDKYREVVKRFKKCYKEFIKDFCKSFPEYSNRAKEVYFNIDDWNSFISQFIEKLEPHIASISKKMKLYF